MEKGYIVEKSFMHKGYACAVTMSKVLGHRCGYVGVPKGHKLYGKNYYGDKVYELIDCHGGLTYSSKKEGESYPSPEFSEFWWFGWDYAHYRDAIDILGYIMNFGEDEYRKREEYFIKNPEGIAYSLEYVIDECERVVEQMEGNIMEFVEATEKIISEWKPPVDWSKVAVDTPIIVWNCSEKYKRYFAKYAAGKVYAWNSGCTSWNANEAIDWQHAELAEVENDER